MDAEFEQSSGRLWPFSVLPVLVYNLGSLLLFGFYYGLVYRQPQLAARVGLGQVYFLLYLFINTGHWLFVLALRRRLKRVGSSLRLLFAAGGSPWRFRWGPAIVLFAVLNGLFLAYVALVSTLYGGWPRLSGLWPWQQLLLIVYVPLSAGFCEELIWRGYLIPGFESEGRSSRTAVVLSAISFALIHGFILPDRLLVTFVIGLVAGVYFARERALVPLMVTHAFVDVWSLGLSLFVP